MSSKREEMEAAIVKDFPEINPFILKNLLDVYFAEGGKVALDAIVKEQIRRDRKNPAKKPAAPTTPAEIITNVEVRRWEDTDYEQRIEEAKASVFKIISAEE